MRLSVALLIAAAIALSAVSGGLITSRCGAFGSEGSAYSQRTLTFAERVAYQRAIEDVYWRHRIWPKENTKPKPSLDEIMSAQRIEKKVQDYLLKSQALETCYQRAFDWQQLQAEMERMARDTKRPGVLRELFEALANDPFVIAECLTKPILTQRAFNELFANEEYHGFAFLLSQTTAGKSNMTPLGNPNYRLPQIDQCIDDTWTATSITNAPGARESHTAVWTGSEMIIWGGFNGSNDLNSGGRYDPTTDSWSTTSVVNAPVSRDNHTAVWTGSEMIVWGGFASGPNYFDTGGRYNPSTDTWVATNMDNAPEARELHKAVWTGSEMIVWGGDQISSGLLNTGGRYNPNTDNWISTSTTNAPAGRRYFTGVWTGNEMIVWGGLGNFGGDTVLNTGGRYNPVTDTWVATTISNAPSARWVHTAVWTGSEMIVWGGSDYPSPSYFNTGGRYDPGTNTWTPTNTTAAPTARWHHTAVWTGSAMIAWGGRDQDFFALNTGGRYNPSTDSWLATSTTNAPAARRAHTAVWTDNEMIVWGGDHGNYLNSGGKYCAQSGPTPTPTASPTPTPTPTPCTGRCAPTPRPRPTPASRL
jgi:N-acetylneuraminic acid mutarotase